MSEYRSFIIAIMAILLVACGGGDPVVSSDDSTDDTVTEPDDGDPEGDGDNNPASVASYYPLQFYLTGEGYVAESGVFRGIWFSPLIHGYVISPVNANTLEPLDAPSISNYSLTVDEEPVTEAEQGLLMQKVVGLPVNLHTAILIDTSPSNSAAAGVDVSALVAEVKDFIATAQASDNPVIANQEFTLVAYAGSGAGIEDVVPDLTADAAVLNAALDALPATWDDRGSSSATYEAIVKAVGRYQGAGTGGISSDVDFFADDLDDLTEGFTYNGNFLSNNAYQLTGLDIASIVLISAGDNTNTQAFFKADAQLALEWQSLLQYDEESDDGSDNDSGDSSDSGSSATENSATITVGKPLIYVSVSDSETAPSANIAELASAVIDTDSLTSFSFANQVVTAQENALDNRLKADNQYLVRYVMFERDGTHETIFASKSDGYNYALTTDIDFSDGGFLSVPQAEPSVEIAGPKNAYLPAGNVSLANVTTLYPATRWTVATYEPADYSWTVGGSPRNKNGDGSITISSSDVGKAVVLTNDSLSSGMTSATLTVVE